MPTGSDGEAADAAGDDDDSVKPAVAGAEFSGGKRRTGGADANGLVSGV